MQDIRVPKFGMSAVEVEVLDILVKPGERVEAGQAVIEAASDKVDFSIEAESAGIVKNILISVGDICAMGSIVMTLHD